MVSILSEKLAKKLFECNDHSIQTKTSIEVYKYGLDLIISSLCNIAILLIIASVLRIQWEVILFTTCFAALRVTTGGYHATSHFKCLSYYAISMFVIIGVVNLIDAKIIFNSLISINALISTILIFIYSPVASRNKPLDDNEKTLYKKRSRITIIIITAILISLMIGWKDSTRYLMICSVALLGQALTLIPVLNRKEKI